MADFFFQTDLFNYFRSIIFMFEAASRAGQCLLNDLNQFLRLMCGRGQYGLHV